MREQCGALSPATFFFSNEFFPTHFSLSPLLHSRPFARIREHAGVVSARAPFPPPPSAAARSSLSETEGILTSIVVDFLSFFFQSKMTWTGAAPVAPPPGYDPRHPERDPVGAAAAREAAARASAVRVEKAKVRLIFEKLNRPSLVARSALFLNLNTSKQKKQPTTAPPRAAQEVLQGVRGQPPPGLRRTRGQVHGQHQGRERDGGEKIGIGIGLSFFLFFGFFVFFRLLSVFLPSLFALSRSLALSLTRSRRKQKQLSRTTTVDQRAEEVEKEIFVFSLRGRKRKVFFEFGEKTTL